MRLAPFQWIGSNPVYAVGLYSLTTAVRSPLVQGVTQAQSTGLKVLLPLMGICRLPASNRALAYAWLKAEN